VPKKGWWCVAWITLWPGIAVAEAPGWNLLWGTLIMVAATLYLARSAGHLARSAGRRAP